MKYYATLKNNRAAVHKLIRKDCQIFIRGKCAEQCIMLKKIYFHFIVSICEKIYLFSYISMKLSAKIQVTCGEGTGWVGFRHGRRAFFFTRPCKSISYFKKKEEPYLKDSMQSKGDSYGILWPITSHWHKFYHPSCETPPLSKK